ncbi:hypothetical protein BAJUN_01030 [Bajunvirus bajun]|uniref:Uncharacterized protein n=1 Tax=Brevundimonas phage vB_BgoS-Bajun TaxID=2948594 RepID=A0A9E7SRK7_9CAUD|nr:hypothetical protein BAJUN_01030 [Brevundimonas phage vB_BgoS-Bajun]
MSDTVLVDAAKAWEIRRLMNSINSRRSGMTPERAVGDAMQPAWDRCRGNLTISLNKAQGLLTGTATALEAFDDPVIPSLVAALHHVGRVLEVQYLPEMDQLRHRGDEVHLQVQIASFIQEHGFAHPVDYIGAPFILGETYETFDGRSVKIVELKHDLKGYETVLGDDDKHRYDRSGLQERGRCTGSKATSPHNLYPRRLYA